MITGIHAMLYSRDADATRTFLAKALGLESVDAGRGWLIFALPPAEIAVHPTDEETRAELYWMCDNVEATSGALLASGATVVHAVADRGWGRVTTLRIPGDIALALYEPRHPTALALSVDRAVALRSRSS